MPVGQIITQVLTRYDDLTHKLFIAGWFGLIQGGIVVAAGFAFRATRQD